MPANTARRKQQQLTGGDFAIDIQYIQLVTFSKSELSVKMCKWYGC